MAQPADPRFVIVVTEEMIRHSRILDLLYFGGFVYGVLELLLILRFSSRMRDLASRLSSRPYVVALIYVVFFAVVAAMLDFPLSFYRGYIVRHEFNLSNQTFPAWLWDEVKGFFVGLLFALIVVPLALLVIRRFKRWWLVLWAATIPLTILMFAIVPVVVDPVFNRFEPLRDRVLEQKLLDEAARAGIQGSCVYQVDKSRQTKQMNAYVTGLGPTKRIVLWDTLIQGLTQDEILAVMGHEIGHYVMHHIWAGVVLTIAIAFPVLFLAQRVYEWGMGRRGISERGDPASLPWLLLIVAVITFLLEPLQNGLSRHFEHQADIYGLELTHFNEPMASAHVKFAKTSKLNPYPHPFIEFWRYTHPSLGKRIDFILRYRPKNHQSTTETQRAQRTSVSSVSVVKDSHTRLAVSRNLSTSNSHIATANFASSCGSNASASESVFLSQARTMTCSSPARTETDRGESSMNATSPRTSPGPTVATTVG